jgi:formylglycine-generating enzyme required for sulfatase activity
VCEVTTKGIVWILIPGGTFMMGSEEGFPKEQPVHQVHVPTFEMSKTEVTLSQYQSCVDDGACTIPDNLNPCNWDVSGRDDHPVNCMTWHRASSFCQWAGGRLPSEAEWEYAARSGGQDMTYPWGEDLPSCDYVVMEGGCGQQRTWEVCSKTAGNTTQGLCDMAGNVFEWVQDTFQGSYDCDANPDALDCESGGLAPTDGSAWESPTNWYRVIRGGAWRYSSNDSYYFKTTHRSYDEPTFYGDLDGFRCARSM